MAETAFRFEGEVVYWRGPAPFLFVRVPEAIAGNIAPLARAASYGWGCIPVKARVGEVAFTTSLFPRDGTYLVPLKIAARRQMDPVEIGDMLAVDLVIAESVSSKSGNGFAVRKRDKTNNSKG